MTMTTDTSRHLKFTIEEGHVRLLTTCQSDTHPPPGEKGPFKPVAPGIIGHWVEINKAPGSTVYRQFLRNLLPLPSTPQLKTKGKSSKGHKAFDINIPMTEGPYELFIYEQTLPAPDVKQTRRLVHTRIDLNTCQTKHKQRKAN